MIESYMGPTANYAGSNSERQSVGLPGHCVRCAEHGHVQAHPDLGCGDVGCTSAHDEDPTPDASTSQAVPGSSTETTIRRVVETHLFQTTSSTSRRGIVTKRAGCSCDPEVEFEWTGREEAHRAHLYAAIYAAGHASGLCARQVADPEDSQ